MSGEAWFLLVHWQMGGQSTCVVRVRCPPCRTEEEGGRLGTPGQRPGSRSASVSIVVAAAVLVTAVPRPALACLVGPEEHEIDSGEVGVDVTAPGEIPAVSYDVRRGRGPEGVGCVGYSSTSLDGLGWVSLTVTPPADDRTPAGKMGYLIVLAGGSPPDGLEMPEHPWRQGEGGSLTLSWADQAEDDQEPFEMQLEIIPVDLAGNEGPAYVLTVSDSGSDSGFGCAVGLSAASMWPLGLAFIALALFRLIRKGGL